MRYYIIAGEASGDLHGGNLIKALRKEDADAEIYAWGGDLMKDAGAVLRKHYRDLAFMGFVEVVKHLRTIFRNLAFCKQDIAAFKPDVLVLIDYPGFNLRMAEWAHKQHIKVFYYISPQIWAWHSSRISQIKKFVDRMFVILPFEKAFYAKHQYEVDFVGHPLLDEVSKFRPDARFFSRNDLSAKPIIAILPGSREQEISSILPVVLGVTSFFPDHQFVIAAAPAQDYSLYLDLTKGKNVSIVRNQTYQLLHHAKAAVVASGTATLETALFDVPEVVVYKGNWISYHIAKCLIDIKYISLVNLIADDEIVRELIQDNFNIGNLTVELKKILNDDYQQKMKQQYRSLREELGNDGASERCAKTMVRSLK